MSMLHTLGWSRRHHLRNPELAPWPSAASVDSAEGDVRIAGESLVGMADAAGTPCTRVCEAAVGSWSAAVGERYCGVVVTAVEAVVPAVGGMSGAEVWIDAELDGCEPLEETMRMIGRVSQAAPARFVVRPSRRSGEVRASLAGDLRAGDLIAFVAARPVALHDIRRRTRHHERLL
ncbi:MAG: hypothetical protein Q7T71_10060 [Herbiconiux sp.]|nr:hypothetical protein [Herbiconiux sp.]